MLNFISNYIFWTKVLNRLSAEKNRLWNFLPINYISHKKIGDIPDKQSFKYKLQSMLGTFDANLLSYIDWEEKKKIICSAEDSIAHNFNLLGSGEVHLDPIDWHTDFKSGYKWPKGKFYKKYKQVDLYNNADIKVPWELSRCHHLLCLGEAYLITKDEKYAQEVIDQILNWIEENPLMYSINWTCSMDVSIRAVNWLFAVNMIIDSSRVSDDLVCRIYKSFFEHGFFIYNNLEKVIPYSNNHYVADIVGLLYLGQLFYQQKRGKRWWYFSLSEFYTEIRQQVLPSGVHYERSVSYHRLVTELFSYPLYMISRLEVIIPIDILPRIQSMYNYIKYYSKQNDMAPLIGDNDNGRFLPFMQYDFRDHRYLLDGTSLDNIIISAGMKNLFVNDDNGIDGSILLEDAGVAILRKGNAYIFINNGGFSKFMNNNEVLIGTHTHNDLLSFVLSVGKDDVIIDPGTFVYTSNPLLRNQFRSSKMHNTIIVDNEEQNYLSKNDMFTVVKNFYNNVLHYKLDSNIDTCVGSYMTIDCRMQHQRLFKLYKDLVIISDTIHKEGNNHYIELRYNLDDCIEPLLCTKHIFFESNSYCFEICFESEVDYDIAIIEGVISKSYGVKCNNKCILISLFFSKMLKFNTIIKWKAK